MTMHLTSRLLGQSRIAGRPWLTLLAGLGTGSTALFFLDPTLGRQRRARARDWLTREAHLGQREVGRLERHVSNRTRGVFATLRAALRERAVSDDILEERVRAA